MDPIEQQESQVLNALEPRFLRGLQHKDLGEFDKAEDIFRDLLAIEPRLAEPHLELARILLDTDRVTDAEEHARAALEQLERGGQWTEDIPENIMLGLAHAVLAEALRRKADENNMIFGDAAAFNKVVQEAQAHFLKASQLDPDDSYSSYHATFLGDPQGVQKVLPGQSAASDTDQDA